MRSRVVAAVLVVVGLLALIVLAVRIGVLWIVEPAEEPLVPTAAFLVAAGLLVRVLLGGTARRIPIRAALGTAAAGLVLVGVVRVLAEATRGSSGTGFVRYGPGSPPSISWTLLWSGVAGPALAVVALTLVGVGLVCALLATVRRLAVRLPAS